jgi:hypothetical protein
MTIGATSPTLPIHAAPDRRRDDRSVVVFSETDDSRFGLIGPEAIMV